MNKYDIQNKTHRELCLDTIMLRTEVDPETKCIEYQGQLNHAGYGRLGKNYRATLCSGTRNACRSVWRLNGKVVNEDQEIRHLCDNPKCVNLGHLAVGTPQDNANDRTKPLSQLTTAAVINRERKAHELFLNLYRERARRGGAV